MQDSQGFSDHELMENPKIKKAISRDSQEMIERRKHVPLVCEVFHQPYTRLISQDAYRFDVDREARKSLPAIIGNGVQKVVGEKEPDETFKASYGKQRKYRYCLLRRPGPGWSQCHRRGLRCSQKSESGKQHLRVSAGPGRHRGKRCYRNRW
jgi:hypothetical protein